MIIEIDDLSIEVIRKPIKNINLRVYPEDGSIKVSIPLKFSLGKLQNTLELKKDWIKNQKIKFISKAKISEKIIETGQVPFLGQYYPVKIFRFQDNNHIELTPHSLDVYLDPESNEELIPNLLDHWYRSKMSTVIPELMHRWEIIIGVSCSKWVIRKMKSRWGSCNPRTTKICLNLNLIKKPLICLEYVLVHELIHLLEPSHNSRFYYFMDKYMPQWRKYKHILES